MTNEPISNSKPFSEVSTPAPDHYTLPIKPCLFCQHSPKQLPSIFSQHLGLHPQTTMLDKIMAATQLENSTHNITEALINGVLQLSETVEFLKNEMRHLEHKLSKIGLDKKQIESKRKRRKAIDLERNYICSYKNCHKSYASDISLNLHIRLKHKEVQIEKQNQRKTSLTYPTESTEARFQLPPEILKGVQSEYSRLMFENQHQQ